MTSSFHWAGHNLYYLHSSPDFLALCLHILCIQVLDILRFAHEDCNEAYQIGLVTIIFMCCFGKNFMCFELLMSFSSGFGDWKVIQLGPRSCTRKKRFNNYFTYRNVFSLSDFSILTLNCCDL
jgi:hypothetical protein